MKQILLIMMVALFLVPHISLAQKLEQVEGLVAESSDEKKQKSPFRKFMGKVKKLGDKVSDKTRRVTNCRKKCLTDKAANSCQKLSDEEAEKNPKCFKKGCLRKCMEKM